MVPVAKPSSPTLLPVGEGRKPPSRRVMWIASFPGAVIDGVSFVDCIFHGVRSTEVVEASGSILFRNVKIEPAEKGKKFELMAHVAVRPTSNWPLIENRKIAGLTPISHSQVIGFPMRPHF